MAVRHRSAVSSGLVRVGGGKEGPPLPCTALHCVVVNRGAPANITSGGAGKPSPKQLAADHAGYVDLRLRPLYAGSLQHSRPVWAGSRLRVYTLRRYSTGSWFIGAGMRRLCPCPCCRMVFAPPGTPGDLCHCQVYCHNGMAPTVAGSMGVKEPSESDVSKQIGKSGSFQWACWIFAVVRSVRASLTTSKRRSIAVG